MNIREANINDLEPLAVLFDGYRIFYRKEPNLEGARQFLTERLDDGDSKIYVSENQEGSLVGFVQLYPLFSSTRMEKLWLLNDLFVSPSSRGKGISLKLIEKAKELVLQSSACAMFLETEKTNQIGNNLYPKAGFELNESSNFYEWSIK